MGSSRVADSRDDGLEVVLDITKWRKAKVCMCWLMDIQKENTIEEYGSNADN